MLSNDITIIESRLDIAAQWLPKNGIGCELGVRDGAFSETLLLSQPTTLHLVDWWSTHPSHPVAWADYLRKVQTRFAEQIRSRQVVIEDGHIDRVMARFDDDYLDWVYIDSDHKYESVRRDIDWSLRKVKRGGIISGHDFVTDSKYREYGVVRAVLEAVQAGGMRIIALTCDDPYQSWVAVKV
jgi:hypothetical protein